MAIIGIYSNEDCCGKDTVGIIIQELLLGHTTEEILDSFNNGFGTKEQREDSGWKIKKFATKAVKDYKFLTGIDFHTLDREAKELERPKFIRFVEACKELEGSGIWVKALFRDYMDQCNWIITDVRFIDEIMTIREKKGVIIYVFKNNPIPTTLKTWDYEIYNNGTIEELIEKVRVILQDLKLL